MYRHIEKDEKKLTDEEIVKALECCTVDEVTDCENCPLLRESCAIIRKYALDLIHRLQAENTRLETAVDSAYNSIEIIGRNAHGMCTKLEDEKVELQKEIEQLKDENCHDYHCMCLAQQEKAELQKQVDELTKYKEFVDACKLGADIEIVMNRVKPYAILREKAHNQAVKDTAKEIYTQVLEWIPICEGYGEFIDNLESWLKERYGVEVE